MVDISAKPITTREARARGTVRMSAQALRAIIDGNLPKGDVMTTARIAGIQAAKRTSELIPMCHPLALSLVDVDCTPNERTPGIDVTSRSEEHTSELQSRQYLVCRLLLEKKKKKTKNKK